MGITAPWRAAKHQCVYLDFKCCSLLFLMRKCFPVLINCHRCRVHAALTATYKLALVSLHLSQLNLACVAKHLFANRCHIQTGNKNSSDWSFSESVSKNSHAKAPLQGYASTNLQLHDGCVQVVGGFTRRSHEPCLPH